MKEALLFDQGMLPHTDLFNPFALTDVLTEFSGEQEQPIIHFWQLPKTLILGMKDSRVPYFNEAVKEGVAIMMYLSVNGDQNLRGKIVRSYYQSGLRDQFGVDYPPVNPDSMTTLDDTAFYEVSVNSVKKELLQVMPHHDQTDSLPNFYQLEEYQRRVQNMQQRNTLIQEVLNDL